MMELKCKKCNKELVRKPSTLGDSVYICPQCDKLYWLGGQVAQIDGEFIWKGDGLHEI